MNFDLAVIGGLGFSMDGLADEVETAYGRVLIIRSRIRGISVAFISRHGPGHLPPHKVDYRALICAAKRSGADAIISTNTVGSMAGHIPGSLFLPTDFVEFTSCRHNTFFEDRAVHVDMSQPYCPILRGALAQAASGFGRPAAEGVYVCAQGPHLESPAQIRMMREFGDVVGMTGYPEVVLAREAGMCYASLCVVTNPAAGTAEGSDLSLAAISDIMKDSKEAILQIIQQAASKIEGDRPCGCRRCQDDAKL
jgi:5'-methylthioadenosine phosphorylase